MRPIITLCLLSLTLAACDPAGPNEAKPTEQIQTAPREAVTPVEDVAEVALKPAIPKVEVQQLFDAWLAAQNDGTFETYAALYAARFEGIKRVGARMFRYGHDGWLKDRQRMFKKKMTVSAADVRIRTTPSTAVLMFEQTWASGSFKDVGPKQLTIVKTPQGLRIAREEMIASYLRRKAGEKPPYDPQILGLVVDGMLVLDIAPKSEWERGPAEIVERPHSAMKDVNVEASGFGIWMGREVELFSPDGTVCAATIEGLSLLARVVPHFGTIGAWNGEGDEKRSSDAYVAKAIWSMAANYEWGPPYTLNSGIDLVARLDKPCPNAVWGRPKGGESQPISARALTGAPLKDALSAFTKLPGYEAEQLEFEAYDHEGAWHQAKDASVTFNSFGDWTLGAARTGYGCGGFEGAFWAFWQKDENKLVLQTDRNDPGLWYFSPVAAVRHAEVVYFVEAERVVARVGDSWELIWEVLRPSYDCAC